MYQRLASEVEFALDATTRQGEIKTHSVTSRVKALDSVHRKAQEKERQDPLREIGDVVGVRVVVLFLSDLPRLDELIRSSFDVHSAEDKIASSDPSSFGYMSIHYEASLGDEHRGPRYDGLKDQPFEIQTRTVVMDAWANVSHYLDYKGSSSVPEDLRRDFFALSGLFYVADQHFEMFAGRSGESQEEARKEVQATSKKGIEVNLDTTQAFLLERFPDRKHASRSAIGEFVEEIVAAGYDDIRVLEERVDRVKARFDDYEEQRGRSQGNRFTDLGVARISLGLADQAYFESLYPDSSDLRRFVVWDSD